MQKNLEFKAGVRSVEDIKNILKIINANYIETVKQIDTYFYTKYGRLKIREINDSIYQLIFYNRNEEEMFRLSEYQICELSEVREVKEMLQKSLAIRGVIKKKRELYMYENCRIHIDEVENVGKFIEFEYIKEKEGAESRQLINYLYTLISPYISKIYKESYIDMI